MSAAAERKPYYPPTHTERVTISLSDFSNDEIAEYLRHEGYRVDGSAVGEHRKVAGDGLWIDPADIERIDTLALCGQKAEACEWLAELVGTEIGRSLT